MNGQDFSDKLITGWLGLVLILCLNSACNPMFKLIVGAKSPSEPNQKELEKWIAKHKIGSYAVYTLDTSFAEFIDNRTHNPYSKKLFKQPMLILSFQNGIPVSANNNCSFPGLPTIHWNEFGTFDQFPPTSSYPDSLINMLRYSDLSTQLIPFNGKSMNTGTLADTLVVIVISKTYHRQSKALVKTVLSKYPGRTNNIVFVNNDRYIFYKLNTGFQ